MPFNQPPIPIDTPFLTLPFIFFPSPFEPEERARQEIDQLLWTDRGATWKEKQASENNQGITNYLFDKSKIFLNNNNIGSLDKAEPFVR